jgi:hypothetical protein
LHDRLSRIGDFVESFNVSRRCHSEPKGALYANEWSRLAYDFHELLIAGTVRIPNDPLLLQS